MLMKNEPLHTLTRQYENTLFLLNEVFPFVRRNPDNVDLEDWHTCGTVKCILGWYEELRYGDDRISGATMPLLLAMNSDLDPVTQAIEDEFGDDMRGYIDVPDDPGILFHANVFGDEFSDGGDLGLREQYVRYYAEQLKARIEELAHA